MNQPKRPIRLVALDLDGTTLNREHQLNQSTIDAIRAVHTRGVKVVLASGRLPHSILPLAQRLGLEGVHIGLNGGVAFDTQGGWRHRHLLTLDQLKLACRVLNDAGLDPLIFGLGGLWAAQHSDAVNFLYSGGEPPARPYDPEHLERIEDPVKVVVVLPPSPRDQHLAALVEPTLHAVRSGPRFLEFMPPGVTKGAALTEYLKDIGLHKDHVMAVGDSENDASMFSAAGFSVAMGNAVDTLKAQADAVTGNNEVDGVAQALHQWILDFDGQ